MGEWLLGWRGGRRLKSALRATAVATKSTQVDRVRDEPIAFPLRQCAPSPVHFSGLRGRRPLAPISIGGSRTLALPLILALLLALCAPARARADGTTPD